MATTSTPFSVSSTLIDAKVPRQQAAAPHCVSLPALPPAASAWKTASRCRRTARNVITMATGETQVVTASETSVPVAPTSEEPTEATTEVPEILEKVQAAWDKVDDKYAVISLAVAGVIVLWGSTGLISAIDKLPLLPGVLELVGIGYTGWFVYQNLIFQPDRDAILKKIKDTYSDIIGSY